MYSQDCLDFGRFDSVTRVKIVRVKRRRRLMLANNSSRKNIEISIRKVKPLQQLETIRYFPQFPSDIHSPCPIAKGTHPEKRRQNKKERKKCRKNKKGQAMKWKERSDKE